MKRENRVQTLLTEFIKKERDGTSSIESERIVISIHGFGLNIHEKFSLSDLDKAIELLERVSDSLTDFLTFLHAKKLYEMIRNGANDQV